MYLFISNYFFYFLRLQSHNFTIPFSSSKLSLYPQLFSCKFTGSLFNTCCYINICTYIYIPKFIGTTYSVFIVTCVYVLCVCECVTTWYGITNRYVLTWSSIISPTLNIPQLPTVLYIGLNPDLPPCPSTSPCLLFLFCSCLGNHVVEALWVQHWTFLETQSHSKLLDFLVIY